MTRSATRRSAREYRTTTALHVGLLRHFGHAGFRPGQEPLVRALLGGRDAIGLLPTGGGKSVTYLLPAALSGDLTLVVSPLVSLMADQVRRAREAGLPAGALHAGVPAAERRSLIARALEGELRVLLLAPERLTSPSLAPLLASGRIGRVAVDEAHCLIQWGFDFRPAYLRLAGIGRRLDCPVLAVTATATPSVRRAIEEVLELHDPARVVGSFDRPNLRWRVCRVRREEERWTRLRRELARPGAGLVYAPTRRLVEAIRSALAARGVGAEAYHAGLAAVERARVQERFLGGDVRVVVATNAFGMGVDKADVRRVVHWAPPASIEAWYQEAGRAGRDGEPADCLIFWAPEDLRFQARLARGGGGRPSRIGVEVGRGAGDGSEGGAGRGTGLSAAGGTGLGVGRVAGLGVGRVAGLGAGRVAGLGAGRVAGLSSRDRPADHASPDPRDPAMVARWRRASRRRLRAMGRFLRSRGCRRGAVLAYLGEEAPPRRCTACDRCARATSL